MCRRIFFGFFNPLFDILIESLSFSGLDKRMMFLYLVAFLRILTIRCRNASRCSSVILRVRFFGLDRLLIRGPSFSLSNVLSYSISYLMLSKIESIAKCVLTCCNEYTHIVLHCQDKLRISDQVFIHHIVFISKANCMSCLSSNVYIYHIHHVLQCNQKLHNESTLLIAIDMMFRIDHTPIYASFCMLSQLIIRNRI